MLLKKPVLLVFAFIVICVHARFLQAGIILSLVSNTNSVNLSANPTQQFVIGVRGQSDVGTQNLFAYTIPVDLSNPIGTETPPGWTVLSVTRTSKFGGDLSTGNLNPSEGDVSMSETRLQTPVSFTTTPETLFEFTVEVSRNSAANGIYNASIVSNGALFALNTSADGAVLPLNQVSFGTVSIEIVGVPEPSSLALFGFAAVSLFGLGARFRKRSRLGIV